MIDGLVDLVLKGRPSTVEKVLLQVLKSKSIAKTGNF